MASNSLKQGLGAVIGAVIGFVVAGPAGALKGAAIGYTIGTAFTTIELPPGPRLENKEFTDSSYGSAIPQLYGTDVVPTNVIWMLNNEYQESSKKVEVAKGQYQTQTSYYANFALALGEGPFKRIVRLYANNILIFNADDGFISSDLSPNQTLFKTTGSKIGQRVGLGGGQAIRIGGGIAGYRTNQDVVKGAIRFYRGDYQQGPDPMILAAEGVEAPAFRGIAYIVFENFELSTKFFNTMPTFKVIAERVDFLPDTTVNADVLDIQKLNFTSDDGSVTNSEVYLDIGSSLASLKYDFYNTKGNGKLVPYESGFMCVTAATSGVVYSSWGTGYGRFLPWQKETRKDIRFTFTNTNTVSFPATYSRKAISLIASQYAKNTLIIDNDVGRLSKPSAQHLFSEEVWLYPFDMPSKETLLAPWMELDVGFTISTHLLTVTPILNTNDLFLIIYAIGASTNFLFAIGKLRNGRFRVNVIDGFDPRNYDAAGNTNWSSSWGTRTASNGASYTDRLSCFYHNDNVYIYFNDYTNASEFVNMCATLIVPIGDRNFGFPTPFTRRDSLFDWSTFTSYTDGDFYNIDNEIYNLFNKRKFITDWYVAPYTYAKLIPDYETGELYGWQTATYDTAATTAFPNLASIAVGNLYKLDRDTLEPVIDYGNLSNYINATVPVVSGGAIAAYNASLSRINGVFLARVIKDNLYIITSFGMIKIVNNAFVDFKYLLTSNYIYPQIERFGEPPSTVTTNSIPAWNSYTHNLIPLLLNDDITEVLVGSYLTDEAYFPSAQATSGQLHCFAEYCVLRFFHGPYTADLQSNAIVTLDEVVQGQIIKSELLSSTDYDVTDLDDKTFRGMVIAEQAPVINAIQALQQTYLFDIIEEDYKLKFIQRSNASITRTIPYTDLQAAEVNEIPFEIKPTVPANFKAPSLYQANYRDIDMEYEVNTQSIEIPYGESGGSVTVPFPMTLTSAEAYGYLESITRSSEYAQRGIVDIQLTYKHSDLEINKYISVGTEDGSTFTGRIVNIEKGRPGLVKISLLLDSLVNYGNSSFTYIDDARDYVGAKNREIHPIVVDSLPFESSQDVPGYWIGAYKTDSTTISNFTLSVSYDEGTTYTKAFNHGAYAQAAYCLTALPATGGVTYIDYTSVLTIKVLGGEFNTVTNTELLASEQVNTYFYGDDGRWEIIKVLGWTDNGNGTYSSSGILRGYKGTAHYMEGHEIGDKLYGANGTLLRYNPDLDKIGQPIAFKFSTESGFGTDNTKIVETVIQFQGRLPLPVINVTGRRLANNDWYFTWIRQSRVGIEWKNFSDVQQDEATEQYNVYIINTADNNKVVRTISVTDISAATYTSAQQTSDFGSNRTTLSVAIAKVSLLVGVGVPAFSTF